MRTCSVLVFTNLEKTRRHFEKTRCHFEKTRRYFEKTRRHLEKTRRYFEKQMQLVHRISTCAATCQRKLPSKCFFFWNVIVKCLQALLRCLASGVCGPRRFRAGRFYFQLRDELTVTGARTVVSHYLSCGARPPPFEFESSEWMVRTANDERNRCGQKKSKSVGDLKSARFVATYSHHGCVPSVMALIHVNGMFASSVLHCNAFIHT